MKICKHFRQCGGCEFQDVPYEEQILRKEQELETLLQRLPDQDFELEKTVVSDPVFYRNKMEFTFGRGKEGNPILGLHHRGKYWKIENLDECLLLSEKTPAILETIRSFAARNKLEVYDPKTHTGFLRHLVLRHSKTEDRYMITLVTFHDQFALQKEFVGEITDAHPETASAYWGINSSFSDVAL